MVKAELDKAILREAASGNFPVRQSTVGRSSTCVLLRTRHVPEDEPCLVRRITDLATRYRDRRITMKLREEGWRVNHKRIKRQLQLLAERLDGVRQMRRQTDELKSSCETAETSQAVVQ